LRVWPERLLHALGDDQREIVFVVEHVHAKAIEDLVQRRLLGGDRPGRARQRDNDGGYR
jgi:hypothetical protein